MRRFFGLADRRCRTRILLRRENRVARRTAYFLAGRDGTGRSQYPLAFGADERRSGAHRGYSFVMKGFGS